MRYAPRAILAGVLGFAAAFVVACGGGHGLLSGDQSIALNGQADQISSAAQSGNCGAAINASASLNRDVQNLPITVNPTLRSNLTQGAGTIAQLAAKDCHHHTTSTAPKTSSTSSSTSTTHTSTSTSTTTTTTTPTTTSSTSTTTTTATTPTNSGTTSSTTGGAGLGGPTTTTGAGTGTSGGTGPGSGNGSSSTGGGG